ncbi:MAG: hypothetical protein PHO37_06420 [Kiritimatiellae bacterium]|nr:hypothetical protein [Kiritimatiellia bacterium]
MRDRSMRGLRLARALALALVAAGSVAYALELPWGEELHGFVEGRGGVRTRNDPGESERSLTELRAQLDSLNHFELFQLQFRGDLVYDELAHDIGKVDLERGQGFFDLRELNVVFFPVDWADVKVGRQILTWGTGDLLFINDLFPKDWNSFLLGREEQYLKAPSDAILASFFPSFVNIDLVYVPRFDADRYIDGERVSFYDMNGRYVGDDSVMRAGRRDDWFKDDEIAARLYRRFSEYETALYLYHGFWKSPVGYDVSDNRPYFPELNVVGASVKGAAAGGIVNFETGYYDSAEDRGGRDPYIPNSELRLLTGYQRELAQELTAGVQYYVEWMMDYNDYTATLPPDSAARDELRHVVTLRLTQMLMSQNLILDLFTFFSPSDRDAYIRPGATYKISDNWSTNLNGNFFFGERDYTFFGRLRRNNSVNFSVRYNF